MAFAIDNAVRGYHIYKVVKLAYYCKLAYFVAADKLLSCMLDIDVPVVSISWIEPNGGVTTDIST